MKSYEIHSSRKQVLLSILVVSILIFAPLFYGIHKFIDSSASEIVSSWYENELTNIQQGNVLTSASKLQRAIEKSVVLKSAIVVDKKGRELLNIGLPFDWHKAESAKAGSLNKTKLNFYESIYSLGNDQVEVYIYTGSTVLLYLSIAIVLYLAALFVFFGLLVRKQATLEERLSNEQVIHEIKMKGQLNETLSRMARQFSHDVRSPLAALKMILSDVKGMQKDDRDMLDSILFKIDSLAGNILLTNSQNQSLFEYGTLKNESVKELLEAIHKEKSIEYKGLGNLELKLKAQIDVSKCIHVDAHEFQRMISNIINNSVEAMHGHGKILINVFEKDNRAVIQLKDNGSGIPESIIARLGKEGESHNKTHGHGLGLFHAKRLLDFLKGELKIESVMGKGTTITIAMDLAHQEADSLHYDAVLLDDEFIIRKLWSKRANEKGVKLLTLSHSDELFSHLKNLNPHTAIYIDMELSEGDKNGDEILRELSLLGHEQLYLATGYCDIVPEETLPYRIQGKECPF